MEAGLPGRLSACADRSNRAKICPRRGTCGGTPSDLNSFSVLAERSREGASSTHRSKPTISFSLGHKEVRNPNFESVVKEQRRR